ncbi:MAG: hypothetical protein HUJ26_04695 [Planctomycetaceae bacterium]|nr:hypothetical protein [Planctomycetaceae bacterium]
MSVLISLFQQLPMLLMAVPLCGITSVCLATRWGDRLIRRSFLVNGVLSLVCVLLMVLFFTQGPKRTGLSSSESFQQVNLLLTDVEAKAGYRFGVDGCTLWLVVLTAAFPLAAGWENSLSRDRSNINSQRVSPPLNGKITIGLLGLQFGVLAFLLSLDRRVQIVMLLLLAFVVHYLLAVTVSAPCRRLLIRRLRQMLLSDFLIIAGFLCATTPLLRHTNIGNDPAELFDVIRMLAEIEERRFEDITSYERLMQSRTPSMCVMLLGCVLRFGTFPYTTESRKIWRETSPLVRGVWMLYGPVIGLSVIWRELQLFPEFGFQLFAVISYFGVVGLVWLSIQSLLQPSPDDDSLSMVFYSTLLVMVSGGSNTTSLAGALLILTALVGRAVWPHSQDTPQDSFVGLIGWATRFLLTAGSTLAVLGLWQSSGRGARELGLAFFTGLSLVLMATRLREGKPETSRTLHLVSVPSAIGRSTSGEQPVWNLSPVSVPEAERSARVRTIAAIVLTLLLLLMPQWIWQQVRWDFQKLEFPQSANGFSEFVFEFAFRGENEQTVTRLRRSKQSNPPDSTMQTNEKRVTGLPFVAKMEFEDRLFGQEETQP